MDAKQILGYLAERHREQDQWAYFQELATNTGMKDKNRLDAFAMNLWPSNDFQRITYEVKVSRSDFLAELKTPQKRRLGLLYSNLFYFVAPAGLLKPNEIPIECGLMTFNAEGQMHVPLAAPWRETNRPSWGFLAAAFRQAGWLADKRVESRISRNFEERERSIQAREDRLKAGWAELREEQNKLYDANRLAGVR